MLDLLVLAVALAVDATAACAGLGASQRSLRPVIAGALLFGAFQAGMAGLGAWGGAAMASWASAWDHWIAFALLSAIGGKAVHGAWSGRQGPGDAAAEDTAGDAGAALLLTLAFATSVDALAAGVTLPMLPVAPVVSAMVIGVVTVIGSAIGGAVGRRLGAQLGWRIEAAGGLVLVGLGLKILAEHLGTG